MTGKELQELGYHLSGEYLPIMLARDGGQLNRWARWYGEYRPIVWGIFSN